LTKAKGDKQMPPNKFKRKWIKLWIDECLTGTIREELSPEERSVWYDSLLLAGRNRPPGRISANENTSITPKRLASIMNIPTTLLERSMKKFQKTGRVKIDRNGVIHIINWEQYQFTDYDRQKPYREAKKAMKVKTDMPADGPFGGVTNDQYREDYLNSEDYQEDKKGSKIPAAPD